MPGESFSGVLNPPSLTPDAGVSFEAPALPPCALSPIALPQPLEPSPEPLVPPAAPSRITPSRDLLGVLFAMGVGRVAGVLGLLLLVGATEGIGILLLVPLLSAVGIDVSSGGTSAMGRFVEGMLGAVGIPVSLGWILVTYVAIVALRSVLVQYQSYAHSALQVDVVYRLRGGLYRAITSARWSYLARSRLSDFSHALITDASRAGNAVSSLLILLSNAVVSAVFIVLAFQTSFRMSLIAFAAGGLLALLMGSASGRARASGEAISETGREMHATIADHLSGLKVAKAFAAEQRHAEHFDRVGAGAIRAWKTMAASFAFLRFGQETGAVVIVAAILYVSLTFLHVQTATVLLLLFLITRVVPRLSAVQLMQSEVASSLPAFSRLRAVQQACDAEAEPLLSDSPPVPLQREIRLEKVSYRYPGDRGASALSRVDLVIPARAITALVGPSGAGKSTVADLLMGLSLPEVGRLLVDDHPLSAAMLRGWRGQIGFVPQEAFLFHDTIRANLTWAVPSADEAEIVRALRLASAEEFVAALPDGLETVVGERGGQLSGGERQRIALARALLGRPSVLILDEATSALDAEGESRIADAISSLRGEVTTVLITHRLSLASRADLIHVLEGGRVVESGSGRELQGRPGGRFRALRELQSTAPLANRERQSGTSGE
jgi:ATP-binding cassette, subfamily C, bacterial